MPLPTHTRLGQTRFAKGGRLTPWARASTPQPTVPLGTGTDPVVPLVSSWVPGPLELVHLPRMWMEALLAATGRLPEAFAAGRPLFDEILCDTIGIDRAAFRAFVAAMRPDYLGAEHWVNANARILDRCAILSVNTTILRVQEDGMPAYLRDDLRAWQALHAYVVASRGRAIEPIVPALSSRTAGPLGVDHLPRLWMKNLVKTVGALPWSYRAGPVRVVPNGLSFVPTGVDKDTYDNLCIDMYAAVAFIESTQPNYPAFEAWVRASARTLDAGTIARHNAMRVDTRPAKARSEKAAVGWLDESNWGYLIDDLLDWRLAYDVVTRGEIPTWSGPRPSGSTILR